MEQIVKKYEKDGLTVYWKPNTCTHAGKCVKGSPKVFDVNRRPWVKLDEDSIEHIMEVIDRCPSGALSYEKK
ncbi:Fer4_19 domain-containing protein [Campylobacter blaseri]|uniref:(4Fe-4S)-binding protein n=1 Tax=Campylobacter blaseri TaxID=2042961 RepID=A0A2P8R410_9BACT|nr:(4Fe-4S)-binding protein [Campylobacter blaseri]PSM53242.1 (4Fe-4S)-binding protein [Campylobacter blaseri]PSM54708.1 (4Fe-4S)-binding protein [Campylobacter blaseri]QKF86808.1 Fer4_19 domain-containing protein [Campylobacter blaseri]